MLEHNLKTSVLERRLPGWSDGGLAAVARSAMIKDALVADPNFLDDLKGLAAGAAAPKHISPHVSLSLSLSLSIYIYIYINLSLSLSIYIYI